MSFQKTAISGQNKPNSVIFFLIWPNLTLENHKSEIELKKVAELTTFTIK